MTPRIVVIGAGPAGLMAAETLARAGVRVEVHDRMASVGRKFLMAGRGGLNLTHCEPRPGFDARYAEGRETVIPWLDILPPDALRAWADDLGQETFVGSSGRVFPRAMKASPLLRAWLARLEGLGVTIVTRSLFTGFDGDRLTFEDGPPVRPDAVVLALGGAGWPRLGSDGRWQARLQAEGVPVAPLVASNVGVTIAWSDTLIQRHAGAPLKTVALSHGDRKVRGEVVLSRYGLEGGAVYALSAPIRAALAAEGRTMLTLDLKPDLRVETLARRLERPRAKDSLGNWLRKVAGLAPAAVAVVRDIPGDVPTGADKLARRIKGVRLTVTGQQGLERAISSAGGVRAEGLDTSLMLTARPGVFVAGEMIDWDAPTGGYLLQACMASGVAAARGVLDWLGRSDKETA